MQKKKKLDLTCIEFLDKFTCEVQCLFHQVVDVRSEDAVGLRADLYGCGVRCPVVKKNSCENHLNLYLRRLLKPCFPTDSRE